LAPSIPAFQEDVRASRAAAAALDDALELPLPKLVARRLSMSSLLFNKFLKFFGDVGCWI